MTKRILTAILAVGAMNTLPAALLNENFEGATEGLYTTGAIGGTAFSVVSGSVDIAGPADYGHLCVAPAAGKCVDTHGSGTPRGVFETTSALNFATPGTYILQFSLVRWNDVGGADLQDSTVTVTIGSLFNQTYVVDGTWTNQTVTAMFFVAAPTSAALRFTDSGGSAAFAGAILDNVSVSDAVPEPGTVSLVGAGALALLWVRRRSR